MTATVTTAARLHFGFLNLSLDHERLYGGIGVGISEPRLVVSAERGREVESSHSLARWYATRAVDMLSVPGARINVHEELPRHVGLGSGTQLALAVYEAIAHAYDRKSIVRAAAPVLGRGGRSGVGVATFQHGGFVVDGGHPSDEFTVERPQDGKWTVPSVIVRQPIPPDWRFVLVLPDAPAGRNGTNEDASIRTVIKRADPTIAERIGRIVLYRLLPAVVEENIDEFGSAVETIGRLNGEWYGEVQGGVYRQPIGEVVDELNGCRSIDGTGQSSWGPAMYGVTDKNRCESARTDAMAALAAVGIGGSVHVTTPRNCGAQVRVDSN